MSGNSSEKVPILNWRFLSKILPARRSIWILFITVLFISFLDLAGWIFDIDIFKSFRSKWESMELITALCFILSTLTLAIIQLNLPPLTKRILSMSFAFVICAISLGTLSVYIYSMITGHESSITQLSFLSLFLSPLYRMDILTAVNFIFTGCILFLFTAEKKRGPGVAHIITIPVFLISYLTIISYILDVYKATDLKNISVALNTSIAFCGICLAVLLMRPDTWLMKLYLSRDAAGIISRKLFPTLVFLPVVIGWLRIQGEHAGVIKSEEGVALVAIAYVFCFIILIWLTARSIDKIDQRRRSVEEALRESEEQFRTIAETVPILVCITRTADSVVMFTNEVNNKAFGFRGEDIIGTKGPNYYWNPSDRERMVKIFKEYGVVSNFELKVKKSDGSPFWIMTSVRPIIFKGQAAMIGASIDITESKKIEEALLISEERFRAIAENIPDLIVRFDHDLRLQYANPAVIKRTGLTNESLIGKTSFEYGAELSSSKIWEKSAKEVLSSGKSQRIEQQNTWLGVPKVFDTLIVPEIDLHGKVSSVIIISRDITEKKQSENALKTSEQKLKYHLENSPLAVVEWDKEFRILQWSNEAERIFGLRKDEVLGVRIVLLNIIHKEDIPKVDKTIARLTSGKESKVISQNRNVTKSGEVIDCIWYNSVLLDENGEMSSVLSLVEDITVLRRTEKELFESREGYKELVTNARSIIVRLDTEGRFTFANEFAQIFFGFSEEELLGKLVTDTIVTNTESTGRDLDEMIENIIDDPDKYSVNINENIKKNGELVWVEWHNKALFDESGIRTGHLAIGIDITKRKKAEEALKVSEKKLRSVLDATQESIYMFDPEGHILMSNSTGLSRLNNISENDLIGHHFSEFMPSSIARYRLERLDEVIKTGKTLEFTDERAERIYHHNFFPVFNDEKVTSVVSYSTDITERKISEDLLKASEERFRTIAESLPVLICIYNIKDAAFSFVNEHFEKTFGFYNDQLISRKLPVSFFDAKDRKDLGDLLKEKGRAYNKEIRVKKADGTPFWIMSSTRSILFMNEPSYLTASINITETKKVQEELLRLNRTLDARSRSSQTMMHSDNELNYINDVCKIIIEDCGHAMVWVGYAMNDKNKTVSPVAYYGFDQGYIEKLNITWDESDRGMGPTGTAIRTGKPALCKNMLTDPAFKPWRKAAIERGYASSLVLPLLSDEKSFGAISIYSREPDPFSESEIDLLRILADDLAYGITYLRLAQSERESMTVIKESEAKLKELITTKDKFFNIVAHDLKNPFTSLLGSSELLIDNINSMSVENIRKLALILNDSARSGFSILQNLLDWSRSQTGLLIYNPEDTNLKSIIDENIENLKLQTSTKGISLTADLTDKIIIHSDRNMINTVLRNLLSNAVKYTHKNGKVVVEVLQSSKEIMVSVKDTGTGMTKEKVDSLFRLENSLSTPGTEKEQGTGLGLKLCKEFTERLGGRIWVVSKEGQGSEFKFTIPLKGTKV